MEEKGRVREIQVREHTEYMVLVMIKRTSM